MGNAIIRLTLRLLIAACGCAAGAYCVFAAFQNGSMIAKGFEGMMFGIAFAAVVIASWLMLPWADVLKAAGKTGGMWVWRGGFVLALGFVVANAIAFSVHHRVETVEGKGVRIDGYEEAKADKARAVAELAVLQTNSRWQSTNGCSNARVPKSQGFCGGVKEVQGRIQAAQSIIATGRPGAKDAGAETLAWVLRADSTVVGKALPVYFAIILELIATLCMKGAFTSLPQITPAVRNDTPITFAVELESQPKSLPSASPKQKQKRLPPPRLGPVGYRLSHQKLSAMRQKTANDKAAT